MVGGVPPPAAVPQATTDRSGRVRTHNTPAAVAWKLVPAVTDTLPPASMATSTLRFGARSDRRCWVVATGSTAYRTLPVTVVP